jgi:hypothetical protein
VTSRSDSWRFLSMVTMLNVVTDAQPSPGVPITERPRWHLGVTPHGLDKLPLHRWFWLAHSLSPTVLTWRMGVPLGTVRFSAANHLLVELVYERSTRLGESYSLRQTRTGDLILHAERADGSDHRSYRVEKIEGLRTTTPFRPRFGLEFSSHGPLHAPPQYRTLVPQDRHASSRGSHWTHAYPYACTRCGCEFAHTKRNATLRLDNDVHRYPRPGRSGCFVGQR